MKQIIKNYTFNASAKTVTLTDFTTVRLDRLQAIVDATLNKFLYNLIDPTISATVATNVITLSSSSSAANSDTLEIIYDCIAGDPTYDAPVVTGNVASGATDSGNPVKIGGKYNATLPTLTDGQRGDLQLDTGGRTVVTLGTSLAGEDIANNVLGVQAKPVVGPQYAPYLYNNAGSSNAVTKANIKSSSGNVLSIRVTNANASPRYFQLVNSSTAPSAGATAQVWHEIPGGTSAQPASITLDSLYFAPSEYFAFGISWAISTTPTTFTDSTTAGDHNIHVRYV